MTSRCPSAQPAVRVRRCPPRPVSHIPSPTQIKAATGASGGVVGPVLLDGKAVKTRVIKSSKNAVKKVLHKIRFARVVKPFHGKRVLQVRVNGKAGMVSLTSPSSRQEGAHVQALRAGQPQLLGPESPDSGEDREGDGVGDRRLAESQHLGTLGRPASAGLPHLGPLTRRAPRPGGPR